MPYLLSHIKTAAANETVFSLQLLHIEPVVLLHTNTHLYSENRFSKLSLHAQTVALELVASHEVVGMEVESRPTVHDVRYNLSKAASLISIKHVVVCLQVAVEQLDITASINVHR